MNAWTWPPSLNPPPSAAQVATSFYANPGAVSLAVPPAVLGKPVGASDAEFDTDPGWVYFETLPGGPVVQRPFTATLDFGARLAGANPAISFSQRKSFVTLQPGNNSVAGVEGLYCNPTPITWVANQPKWYWCGGGTCYEYVIDTRRALCLMALSGALPDRNNQVCVGNVDPSGGMSPLGAYQIAGGGAVTLTGGPPQNDPMHAGAHWPYFGIYLYPAATRSALGGEGWAWNDNGQKVKLGVLSFPNVLTATYFAGFLLRTPGPSPGTIGMQPNIFQADFFRESIGVTPPWAR
jgi:hypothetical protein